MKNIIKILIALVIVLSICVSSVSCTSFITDIGKTDQNQNNTADSGNGENTDIDSGGANNSGSTADDGENTDNPDNNGGNVTPTPPIDTDDLVEKYSPITVEELLAIAEKYADAPSTEQYIIVAKVDSIESVSKGRMTVSDDTGSIYVYKCSGLSAAGIAVGDIVVIQGTVRNYEGLLEIQSSALIDYRKAGEVTPPVDDTPAVPPSTDIDFPEKGEIITEDPYVNISKDAFYANYRPAVSYMDSYYRSLHDLMSGTIAEQDQAPTLAKNRPMENGMYVRNSTYLFSDDGNTYYVVDSKGEVVMEIYRGGAYIMLEEVAAYVFAFGEPPANHDADKNSSPVGSVWGVYLRLNHTRFTGNTSRYPYEPELPNISGCGGDLTYYEMDIGTTGTDCDPGYPSLPYNNGTSITRGAARIVYTRYDLDGDGIIEVNETFLFYTYNHYNDFQEYLNYEGGWGEMFGNITGGGDISSKINYNPTPYVPTVARPFGSGENTPAAVTVVVAILPSVKDEIYA